MTWNQISRPMTSDVTLTSWPATSPVMRQITRRHPVLSSLPSSIHTLHEDPPCLPLVRLVVVITDPCCRRPQDRRSEARRFRALKLRRNRNAVIAKTNNQFGRENWTTNALRSVSVAAPSATIHKSPTPVLSAVVTMWLSSYVSHTPHYGCQYPAKKATI